MKRVKSLLLAAFAVVLSVSYVLPAAVASAESNTSSAALSIAPKKNYVIDPGKSVQDKLTITNLDQTSPLNLTLRVVDFSYTGNGGTPKLMLDPNATPTTWSLRSDLKVPETVTVDPGKTKQVSIDVSIPAGHGAGSYYSAIVYSSGSGQGGNVGLNASGVTLVFVNVPGKVKEDLTFTHLGAYDRSEQGAISGYRYFMAQMPDSIAYTLKNSGNVIEAPAGSITLRDIFGRTTTINDINPTGSLALIGQERTFTSCIKLKTEDVKLSGTSTKSTTCDAPGLWPGYYSVSADLFYGQNGNLTQEITKTGGFWYLPWWFVVTMIVVLSVAGFYGWRTYNKLRNKFYGPRVAKTKSARRK
jgi:hypothetical protein